MPWTRTRAASGNAMRPVPIPSSSAGPSPASSPRNSTVWPTRAGSPRSPSVESYRSATGPENQSSITLREHPQEGGLPLRFSHRDDLFEQQLEAALPEEPAIRLRIVAGEEHLGAEPLARPVLAPTRAERREGEAARPQPALHPGEERGVLLPRHVADRVEGGHGVERLRRKLDGREVALDER